MAETGPWRAATLLGNPYSRRSPVGAVLPAPGEVAGESSLISLFLCIVIYFMLAGYRLD